MIKHLTPTQIRRYQQSMDQEIPFLPLPEYEPIEAHRSVCSMCFDKTMEDQKREADINSFLEMFLGAPGSKNFKRHPSFTTLELYANEQYDRIKKLWALETHIGQCHLCKACVDDLRECLPAKMDNLHLSDEHIRRFAKWESWSVTEDAANAEAHLPNCKHCFDKVSSICLKTRRVSQYCLKAPVYIGDKKVTDVMNEFYRKITNRHLEQCQKCAHRVQIWKAELELREAGYRFEGDHYKEEIEARSKEILDNDDERPYIDGHIQFYQIADFLNHKLDQEEVSCVEAHMRRCPSCRECVQSVEQERRFRITQTPAAPHKEITLHLCNEELIAFVDEELSEEDHLYLTYHLRECRACVSALIEASHLSDDRLTDHLYQRLNRKLLRITEEHLRVCLVCKWWVDIVQTYGSFRTTQIPAFDKEEIDPHLTDQEVELYLELSSEDVIIEEMEFPEQFDELLTHIAGVRGCKECQQKIAECNKTIDISMINLLQKRDIVIKRLSK
jgi:hypothetical protein